MIEIENTDFGFTLKSCLMVLSVSILSKEMVLFFFKI